VTINHLEVIPMNRSVILSAGLALIGTTALAAGSANLMTSIPSSSLTVADWYKQDVYDPSNTKIGEVMDVLIGPGGQVSSVIVGVGGFLGAGEKDVAVNFNAVKKITKNDKAYLTMDTNKDALKSAPGFKYDSTKTTWVPDTSNNGGKS
jgi:sporulation protein YlmC with PRC-barrel domain